MAIIIESSQIRLTHLRTRMPFRYGIATMTHVPLAFIQLQVSVHGQSVQGTSSDLLPPKWFTKVPDKPLEAEVAEMLQVIRQALRLAEGMSAASVFALWRELYGKQHAWGRDQGLPPLLVHFGTSLVERALIEAYCRAEKTTFFTALSTNALGVDLGSVHGELRGHDPMEFLPRQPRSSVVARHTVGLSDPLLEEDIAAAERLHDGLPQSLAACVQTYGLDHLKIKVQGNLARDTERLQSIAALCEREQTADGAFTLDGNEQFASIGEFRDYWRALTATPGLETWFERLMFVEQPLHREAALQDDVGAVLRAWPDRPPLIIDESDAELESLPRALLLGYVGTSHKNCKGIFKGIANRCLLGWRERMNPGQRYLMSGEDLCNIGPVALLQDLAVMAALDIESVERNGHHYHAGLSQLPEVIQKSVVEHHPDLYDVSPAGWPAVTIRRGRLRLDSVNRAPFGVGFEVPLQGFDLVP